MSNKGLTKLPLKFGKVEGNFRCNNNKLTSLKGCPKEVGGSFYCNHNQLTTLKGCPTKLGDHFWCDNNQLTSLEGCPKEVNGGFNCSYNQLLTLGYGLEYVNFGGFNIEDNPVYEVYKIFGNFKKFKESLDYGYFTKPGEPFIDKLRFEEACMEQEIEAPIEIKGYEFI